MMRKQIYFTVLLIAVFCNFMKSQVNAYSFTQFSDTYTAITGGTVFGSTASDDERFVDPAVPAGGFVNTGPGIPIGFNFVFNGSVFDRIAINNNGWISLGNSTITPNAVDMNSSSSYNALSATSTAPSILQNRIGGLARDLAGQTGSELRVETIGTAPNQTLVVQFTNYTKWASTGDSFDFQIRLSETSNNINIIYGTFTTTTSGSAQIGLRGTSNADFNNRDVATTNAWATSIAGLVNTALVNFNSTLTPASGQNYQWTPPAPCSATPNSGISAITSSTGCPNASFTLSATGLSSSTGIQLQWQQSSTPTGPWTNIVGATTSNYSTSATTTTYYQLVSTCTVSSLSATSSVVSYSIVNPGPCVCAGYGTSMANNAFDEEILNVTFGSLNNTSNCSSIAPGIGSINQRYSNYADFVAAPTVMQGQSVPFSINVGTCGGNYDSGVKIFIDFNQNGSFADAGEEVYVTPSSTNGPFIATGNITIPLTANVGITRMRVVNVETTNPSGITPVGTYGYGETEDYCIDITASTACSGTPNSGIATISSPTTCPNNSLTINTTGLSVAGGLIYQWQSSSSPTGPWSNIVGATTPNYTATAASTTYYQMVTTCTVSGLSATTSVASYSVVNPGPCICNNYGASSASNSFDEDIWNVTFGSLNNTSNCTVVAPGPGSLLNRYSNFAGFVAAPTVMQGQTVPFSVNVNTCGGWFGMEFDIYIDYNQNGSFADAGELAYSTTNAIQGPNTGNILIPLTASVGNTRMRVVAVEGTVPGPTGTYFYGETEDYCIDIIAATNCSGTPNSGIASISTSTGCVTDVFNLSATGITVGNGINYQWQSGPSSTGPWSNMPNGTTVSFTAQASSTTFYQLVTTCTISSLSATSSIVSFTPANCYLMSTTTITTCSGNLYDSGGPSNDYQNNENYTLTLVPSTPNAMAVLTFNAFDTESGFDYLYVYDGNSTSSPLIGQYDGNTLPPVITATNSSGILTLMFTSDGSVVYSGFDISLSCFVPPPCTGSPNSGTATVSNATNCVSAGTSLGATGITTGTGIQYQWFSSPSASGPWTSVPNGTLVNMNVTPANTTFYQLVTTCTLSSLSATSSIVSFTPVNCLIMANNTVTTCASTLYDSGGPLNDYQNSENYTLTIVPATPGASVQLTFTSFSVETCCDYLQIYDGATTAAPLIGQYTAMPPNIVASNAAGVLTLVFYSDGSVVYSGFQAAVSCSAACAGPPSAPAASGASICAGNTVTLTAAATGTAMWYASPTPTSSIANGTLFTTPILTTSTTYYVSDSTSCGQSTLTPVNVTVTPAPSLTITPSIGFAICAGNTSTISASGATTYSWSTNSTSSSIVISPTVTTSYSVTGSAPGCADDVAVIDVTVHALPSVSLTIGASTICAMNGSLALTGSPSGGVYSGVAVTGSLISIANAGTFTPMYSYTNSVTGCVNTATAQLIVSVCSGLNSESLISNGLNVFPNPNNGSFTIESGNVLVKTIEITDVTGRVVYSTISSLEKINVDMNNMANGLYNLKISSDSGTSMIKIIKQ